MSDLFILGTGSYVPERVLTNRMLEEMEIDTSDEWIVRRTGISERRMADPGVCASDLALEASRKALETAGMTPGDIDHIIFATVTPDTCCPSAANWLQAKLDAPRAVTFDVTAACSGFIFALNVAEQYLKCGASQNILVVASEILTRTVNWSDRRTCILWGDGAGALVLSRNGGAHRLLSTHIHSNGAEGEDILLPGGGSKTTPICHESVDKGVHYLDLINANNSFKVAVRYFMEAIQEGLEYNHLSPDDIQWFIPHQANLRMFQYISRHMAIPMEKFYMTIHKYGNISSASCAIALDEAVRDGSIRDDDYVSLPVFGGGLTWGNAMLKW